MTYCFRAYPESVSDTNSRELAKSLNIPLVAANLLCQRGLSTSEQALLYLAPKLKELPSPFLLKDMDRGVELILKAMEKEWPVVVYGDYDVDGICATALLVDFLTLLQLDIHWHIPNRLTEGYGLSCETVRTLGKRFNSEALLITVDNGITAVDEVAEAKLSGFHVLITDHHEPPEIIPDADALINPKQKKCTFPFKELSGAGVAFFLLIALRSTLEKKGYWQNGSLPNLKDYMDLVAMGTVADVMSLVGINRILVRAGTEVLTERRRPGVWALCDQIGLKEGDITAEDISFRLGPRINAAGRMGSPETAAQLLMCKDLEQSIILARDLEQKNRIRRKTENEILPQAIAQCEEQVKKKVTALVVFREDWHPGVIGIVASRLCEKFQLPVIALTSDPNNSNCIKGSGRTIDGINLFEAVNGCKSCLEKFGGHPKAVGLTLQRDVLQDFREKFSEQVNAQHNDTTKSKDLVIDHCIENKEIINQEFISLLRQFEPFGEDNPDPVFLIKNQQLLQVALVKGEHLKFSLQLNGRTFRGIGFGMGKYLPMTQDKIDLAFRLRHSMFRGEKRVELMAVAVNPTS
jgi:single-stranded-DNA-specific exonuclease